MRKRKQDHTAVKYAITVLSAFCIILIGISVFRPAVTGPVYKITGMFVTPVQKGINSFGGWLSGITENLSEAAALREENEALRNQVNTLTAENSQLVLDKEELERLRELMSLSKVYSEYPSVGARVISRSSGNWFDIFTIDKGSDDGISVDCNVIAGSGLVGIVTEVGPNWSTIRSIIDDNSNVSAMISTTSDTCIIAGNLQLIDSGSLSLVKLTDVDNKVHVGDKVVTSNISEKFLPGILIGYVSVLENDANNLTKSGEITPVVDFRHIQEVLVILEKKQYVASKEDHSRMISSNRSPAASQETETENLLTAPRA